MELSKKLLTVSWLLAVTWSTIVSMFRLWLGPAWSDEDREQHLSFFDIIPEVESRISDLVVMVNKRIDEKQLKGFWNSNSFIYLLNNAINSNNFLKPKYYKLLKGNNKKTQRTALKQSARHPHR